MYRHIALVRRIVSVKHASSEQGASWASQAGEGLHALKHATGHFVQSVSLTISPAGEIRMAEMSL